MNDLQSNPDDQNHGGPTPEEKTAAHSRRSFLFKLSLLLNGAVGAVLAVPLIGYLLGPTKKSDGTGSWVDLGGVNQFPIGQTRLIDFKSPDTSLGDGETGKVACWVRRVSAQQFQVFAINCAHLGCPVRWFSESRLFLCPCHGGAYYEDGSRASGPPERGLFEYKYKLSGDSLMIHAGEMPTLATQASCTEKPLIQIEPAVAATTTRPTPWQA